MSSEAETATRKRPREGKSAFDILFAVEVDTQCSTRQKALRGAISHLGVSRAQHGAFSALFKRQAMHIVEMLVADCHGGVQIVLECAAAMPSQSGLLAAALAIGRHSLREFFTALVSGLAHQLELALSSRSGTPARLLLRFIASLAATGVVPVDDAVEQLRAVVAAGSAPGTSPRDEAWYAYAALSSLPWLCNPADTAMASVGGGNPSVEPGLESLLRQCTAAAERLEASPLFGGIGVHMALTEDRQQQLDYMFDAEATDSARAVLPVLSRSSLRQLVDEVTTALSATSAAGEDGSIATNGVRPTRFCALAVRTVARPQEDADVAEFILKPPQPLQRRPAPVITAPESVSEVTADVVTDATMAAAGEALPAADLPSSSTEHMEGGAPSAAAAVPLVPAPSASVQAEDLTPEPLAIVHWEAISRVWSVRAAAPEPVDNASAVFPASSADDLQLRPPFHFFGSSGGLSSSRAVQRAMGLDGPAATPLALWALREVCHDVLITYFPFHRAAAEVLAWLPQGAAVGGRGVCPVPTAPIALECALAQASWLPRAPHPSAYYTITISRILAVVESSGDATATQQCVATLGMIGRILWKYAHLLDDCVVDKLCHLFAHHLSVSNWEWMWDEWAAADAAPVHSTQRRILHTLLQRTFSLAGPFHYDRIVTSHMPQILREASCLPGNFTTAAQSVFLPARALDAPIVTSSDSSAVIDSAASGRPTSLPPASLIALAAGVMDRLRAKADAPGVAAFLASDSANDADPLTRALIIAHCVLMHGRANFKHAQTLLERYKPLLTLAPSDSQPQLTSDLQAHTVLAAVWHIWRRARHVALALCDLLCQLGIVTPAQLVAFALAPLVNFPAGHWHATDDVSSHGHGGDGGADVRLDFIFQRSLSLFWWEAVQHVIDVSATSALAARVELAIFSGAGVLDVNVPEINEDEALARESELAATAAGFDVASAAAIAAVFEHGSASAALLFQAAAERGSEQRAQYVEAARVILAQLRGVCRNHTAVVRALHARGDLASAMAACSHIERIISAALTYVPVVCAIPSPLVRDTGMPMPAASAAAELLPMEQ